ncbi:MAG: molybdate ABC transporter permease subunit, partial [Staphylococcus epidermidis]|nr:molybdate ABC transporter permease subunit [Staphylococcus epidermidis]
MPDLTSFWISFRVALISTMIVTIFGILISKWLYNKNRYWVNLLESFIILPIVLPPTVLGFILLIIFSTRSPVGEFFTN